MFGDSLEDDAVRMRAIGEHKVAESNSQELHIPVEELHLLGCGQKGERTPGCRRSMWLPTLRNGATANQSGSKPGLKPSTLRMASAAIKLLPHGGRTGQSPATQGCQGILSGVTRIKGSAQKQAEGLTETEFSAIISTVCIPRRSRGGNLESKATAKARGEMDIAIIGLMRDALLRVSETEDLIWSDVRQVDDGTGRLLIRRSKTDQQGRGAVAFISEQTMEGLERIRGNASEADRVFDLACNQLGRRIKRAALEAGLGEGFSGHSPRVGMARDLARAGIELPRLMTAGRWRSPRMPALYTRNESVAKGGVIRDNEICRSRQ